MTVILVICYSSELEVDGIIEINRLIVDPTEGLTNLPETPTEIEVVKGCEIEKEGNVGFSDLGKTGLPAQPGDYLRSDSIITPWLPLTSEVQTQLWFLEKGKDFSNFPVKSFIFTSSCVKSSFEKINLFICK